jgi:hypothetical protein
MGLRRKVIGLAVGFALATPASMAAEGDVTNAGAPAQAETLGEEHPSTDDLRLVPGTLGDVGKSMESLPGVSRPGYVDDGPIVWGTEPGNTRVLVDGIEIPMLYHLGGFRSVVGSAMVDSMDLLPGGYGADLGRALGGVVKLETRSPSLVGYWGDFDVNLLDASFAVGAGAGGGGVVVGGRSSYIGSISKETPTDTPWLGGSLRYRDLQATALLALRQGEQMELIGLYSSDFESPDYDFAPITFPTREQSFLRLGARYTRHAPDGTNVSVVPFVGSDRSRTSAVDIYTPAQSSCSGKDVGLRASYRKPLTQSLTVDLGFDGLVTRSNLFRLGDPSIPAREGDITVWGEQLSSGGIALEGWTVTMANLAPSVALEVTPYLEAINLTNRKNAVDYAYSSDFSQRDTVTGLPRTVVAGLALRI